ncbi:MarR family winged helix-turn-helix transcriptional regulator [Actinomycetes bacterium M1A6_2h]
MSEGRERRELESQMASDVRALSAASDQISRIFAQQHSLGPNDFRALLHIMVSDMSGRPSTPGELGQALGLSSAAMTYLVERMITSGHIKRESDESDRRRVILRYDDPGMEVAREFFTPLGGHTREAMADLPDSDLAAAHRVFSAMIDAMKTYHGELGGRRPNASR